jgi:predicted transcriptional regulator
MLAKDLTDETILPAKTSDLATLALTWLDEYKVSHLPIVNGDNYLGLISENDIYSANSFDEPLGNHNLTLNRPAVFENQHIFEVIKLISELNITLVPVLSTKNIYIGVITLKKIIEEINKMSSLESPGAILVLEININDYSLSEISQIVESNDTKIISLYITSHNDSTKLEVTIKLNRMDINPLLQTFYRYNYNVTSIIAESDLNDDMQDRFDSLMKFLSI